MQLKLLFIFSVLLWSCNSKDSEKTSSESQTLQNLKKNNNIKHAQRFAISENEKCKVIYLFGNVNISDTTAIYILLKDTTVNLKSHDKTFVFKNGCEKIASLSSVYTNMLAELGALEKVAAVENIDYYSNIKILEKFRANQLLELNKNPEIDIEKTVLLAPDIIFTFGMGNAEKSAHRKIINAGIPLVVTVDHLEETPLARAEWIKFFAAFVNKESLADSIFNSVEKNYFDLKNLATGMQSKPSVFTEVKYGEIWYVPGGKSFAATFINDAGGSYIWKNDEHTGSLSLGFEEVYVKAKQADFWLNLALVKSKNELISLESRYVEFKAYKTGNLYNNIKNTNNKGYSDYWETGIIFPDRVLSDLILIFHPELKSQIKNDLYYYKKLD